MQYEKLAEIVEAAREALLKTFPDAKITIVARDIVSREVLDGEVHEAGPVVLASNDSFRILAAFFTDPRVFEAAEGARNAQRAQREAAVAPTPAQASHDAAFVAEMTRLFNLPDPGAA